jgi:hypothetical protein
MPIVEAEVFGALKLIRDPKAKARISMDRENLNFASQVLLTFDFLQEHGFLRFDESPTIVRYRKGDLQLNIFHGRRSYEIGLEIGKGNSLFSLREIIRISDKQAADAYFRCVARTLEVVSKGINQLSELLKKYGQRTLDGDQVFYRPRKPAKDLARGVHLRCTRTANSSPGRSSFSKRRL